MVAAEQPLLMPQAETHGAIRHAVSADEVTLDFRSDPDRVGYHQTVVLKGRPGVPFRAHDIVVPRALAPFFELVDVRIGGVSQLAPDQRPLPTWTLWPNSPFSIAFRFGPCQPDDDFMLEIRNVDLAHGAHLFRAMVVGVRAAPG